jgi:hypothetical protein
MLISNGREAFVHSLNGTAAVCAGMLVVIIILVALNLRK